MRRLNIGVDAKMLTLRECPMVTDFFTPDNLSREALLATFDAAMFDVKVDEDGDLLVRETFHVLVAPTSKKSYIRFTCFFEVRPDAGNEAAIALCNRINDILIVIRASMHDATSLVVDWYLPVTGGIGKKTVVLALRKFTELVGAMGEHDTDDVIK
jgi:Putative bacterial sensory transduction regulator